MKKLVFGLIAMVLLTNVTFAQSTSNFIEPQMYGTIYNEIMPIYIEKYKSEKNTDYNIVYSKVLSEIDKKHPNLISNDEKHFYVDRVKEILGENTDLVNQDFNTIFNKVVKKYYSLKLQSVLLNIFEKNQSSEDILNGINILSNDKELTNDDIQEIEKMKSVLNVLITEANNNPSNTTLRGKCNPHHQQFIAGVAGMMFGGWGSLIFVAIVTEIQDQHGGRCI